VTARNPFITAYQKMNGGREEARRQAQAWLSPLQSHLTKQDWVMSRRSSKGMRLIALEGVSLRLGAWPNLRVYSEELRACGRTHGHAFIQPKVKTGRRAHKHSRCSRSPSDPRIAPRELLDYQAIFRGARASAGICFSPHRDYPLLGLLNLVDSVATSFHSPFCLRSTSAGLIDFHSGWTT